MASEAYGDAHPLTDVVTALRGDPAALLPGLRQLLADPHQANATVGLLDDAVRQAMSAAQALLTVPAPDTATAEDFASLVDAAQALFGTVDHVAGLLSAGLSETDKGAA